ncbi:hypothetical protein QPX20_01140 [Corynebacterium accolens]|uniref:hypothetical protein n=1 Tax=Corynebacterium accolens TaxID=38284 RepID=UPI00223C0A11|nr:hypothetical protein [Corynebacterium accolens]MCT1409598.1 hypothetical protein [Corynebacterium accolens]MDK4259145.1 hypothetical protein [Corynebacterium accolens]MDK4270662.1 hypothetical protein [Corynebacterium accolens]
MGLMKMGQGEVKRADVSAPFRALVFPFLELILITGVLWIAIGWCDAEGVEPILRNGLVVLWAGLSTWRFLIPLYKARRKRFIVTNRRVIVREGRYIDSIPLEDIRGARKRRGGISIALNGWDRAMYFPTVAKSKQVAEIINDRPWF